jgi:hypothetical protein
MLAIWACFRLCLLFVLSLLHFPLSLFLCGFLRILSCRFLRAPLFENTSCFHVFIPPCFYPAISSLYSRERSSTFRWCLLGRLLLACGPERRETQCRIGEKCRGKRRVCRCSCWHRVLVPVGEECGFCFCVCFPLSSFLTNFPVYGTRRGKSGFLQEQFNRRQLLEAVAIMAAVSCLPGPDDFFCLHYRLSEIYPLLKACPILNLTFHISHYGCLLYLSSMCVSMFVGSACFSCRQSIRSRRCRCC